jgi:TolA-binding protein
LRHEGLDGLRKRELEDEPRMNSDKFDRIVLDLLYGELDELTTAAAKRHMDQSARAREIFAHFKATRQLSVLPTHAPPTDFEVSLMERERRTLAELPLHHRIGRIISMLAGYAMRPQLIMGALLLLMIGSSLMFLRARPGMHSAVQVTERGAPEADLELTLPVAPQHTDEAPLTSGVFRAMPTSTATQPSGLAEAVALPAAVAASAVINGADSAEGLEPFEQAMVLLREGHNGEAQQQFDRISRAGGNRAAEAALYSAQAIRNASGCAPALPRFERVRVKFPGSGPAYEAAWRAGKCLQQMGDVEGARQSYESLLQVSSHADRARTALAGLSGGGLSAADPGAAKLQANAIAERAANARRSRPSSAAALTPD